MRLDIKFMKAHVRKDLNLKNIAVAHKENSIIGNG